MNCNIVPSEDIDKLLNECERLQERLNLALNWMPKKDRAMFDKLNEVKP